VISDARSDTWPTRLSLSEDAENNPLTVKLKQMERNRWHDASAAIVTYLKC